MDAFQITTSKYRTNDRALSFAVVIFRLVFRIMCRLAPGLAAAMAEWLWFTPPRGRLSARAKALLKTGRPLAVNWNGHKVAAWEWGEGPAVYLLHGWGGNAAQLLEFVTPLVHAGFRAVAFDAPGHGASDYGPSGWRKSNFLEFTAALRAVIDVAGPAHGLIAHSGGVASTAGALREGLRVGRVAFLSSMANPSQYTSVFAAALGLSPKVIEAMRQRAAHRLGFDWEEFSVPATAQRIVVPPALVVHDREDAETPWEEGAAIAAAWPQAQFISTTGLGHRKLLKDPDVVKRVVSFIAEDKTSMQTVSETADFHEAGTVETSVESSLRDGGSRNNDVFSFTFSLPELADKPRKAAGIAGDRGKAVLTAVLLAGAALILGAFSTDAVAKVSQQEADRLKSDLTPVGAEKAGNKDGSIPAWDGGLTKSPPCYKGEGSRYCDPFPEDKPLFTITAANMQQYKDKLSVGQLAMFQKYPQTYKMHVYATRRTAAYLPSYYDATYKNALNASLGGNGEALNGAVIGIPFPIPKTGHEPIWNHKVRYRGRWEQRWNNQFAVTTAGTYNQVKLREDISYTYSQPGATPISLNNVILYFLQIVTAPPRLTGSITLVHETMDQVKEPRRAWQYNPGQRRLRRAPNVGYDNPGTAADGLRTNDQTDTFNGAMDRYTWKIVGKKEMYVPYNSYVLHDGKYKYKDIIQKGHINQDLPRYELHRVWIVDSTTKPGTTHIYKRRTFYLDEDSWQILVVDVYDRRDQLWRWQEAHTINYYDKPLLHPIGETIYDMQGNRYLAQAFNNEDPEYLEKPFSDEYYAPANVSKQALK